MRFVPDESGMGGDWFAPGDVYYEPDMGRWYVFIDQFLSRLATNEEIPEFGTEEPPA